MTAEERRRLESVREGARLQEKGEYHTGMTSRMRAMLAMRPEAYSPADTAFLERLLSTDHPNSWRVLALRLLCRFGRPLPELLDAFAVSMTGEMRRTAMEIAKEQDDLASVMKLGEGRNILEAIAVVREMGGRERLTPYLFLGDETVANLVRAVIENDGGFAGEADHADE